MARKRAKNATTPKYNSGLKPEEVEELEVKLEEAGLSYRQLVKALVRQWMREGGHGVLKYSKK